MLKRALFASAVLLPLTFLGTAPALADVSFGFGVGSPYYGYGYPYHRYYDYGLYDPYGPDYGPYEDDNFYDESADMDVEVIEPAAAPAEPTGCVKTNVKNLKNACSH
ncbi:MAG: hypothetical protein ACREDW_06430 [Aestuariivirgaceae bacterium]